MFRLKCPSKFLLNPPAPLGATRLRGEGCVTGREEAVVVSVMRISVVSVPVTV